MALTDRSTDSATNQAPDRYPAPSRTAAGRGYSVAAFVCAAAAFLVFPIVFGPLGIALGVVANKKGDPLGKWAAITAGVCMVAGMVIGALLLASSS